MKVELVKITPKIAFVYLQRNEVNRTLSAKKVNQYADDILNNNWLSNTGEGISFDWHGKLINGQHRLHAIIKADYPVNMHVFSECDPESFKYIDTAKSRTAGDVLTIEGVKNATALAALITAYYALKNNTMSLSGGNRTELKLSNSKILELYQNNQIFYDETIHYIMAACAKFNRIVTASVLGAIYCMIYEKNPVKAKMFIDELVGYVPKTHNSTVLLADLLTKNKISVKKLPSNYIIACFYKSWNAFIKNKDIKLLKINFENEEFPILLK